MSAFYTRIRGRIQGPFPEEQLRAMVQKGQLSRIHEISSDQQIWYKVSERAELLAPLAYESGAANGAGNVQQALQDDYRPQEQAATFTYSPPPNSAIPLGGASRASQEQTWYYAVNGSQVGPIEQATLVQMLSSGQLAVEAMVWTTGMANWTPASQIAILSNSVMSQRQAYAQPNYGNPGIPHLDMHPNKSNSQMGGHKYCHCCGTSIASMAELCPSCGVRQLNQAQAVNVSSNHLRAPNGKDRVTAALFALLLGGIGVHKFYLGQPILGVIYILFCFTFIPAIIALIEGIVYLSMSDQEFIHKYGGI